VDIQSYYIPETNNNNLFVFRTVPDEDQNADAPGTKRQKVETSTTLENQENTNGSVLNF